MMAVQEWRNMKSWRFLRAPISSPLFSVFIIIIMMGNVPSMATAFFILSTSWRQPHQLSSRHHSSVHHLSAKQQQGRTKDATRNTFQSGIRDDGFDNNAGDDPFGDFDNGDGDDWYNNDDPKNDESILNNDDSSSTSSSSSSSSSSTTSSSTTGNKSHFYSQKSLDDPSYRLKTNDNQNHEIVFDKLCQGAGITRPSKIQSLAWPILLQGKSAILADQTGSGKTLAYLIPLLQRALLLPLASKDDNDDDDGTTPVRKKRPPGTPRIVVLAPTAELADQTRAVCDQLSKYLNFSTMVITATGKYSTMIRDQIRRLQRTPIDVLISTPGRLSTILRTKNAGGLDLSQLQALVLDEVDILLMDDTFGPQLRTIAAAAPVDDMQFVFCTATLPNEIVHTVQREFPNVQQIRGPGLHRVAPTVQQRLVDVSVPPSSSQYNANNNNNRNHEQYCFDVKAVELKKALREHKCRRTLIFCNTVETCRQVENLLTRQDRKSKLYKVYSYHNAMTPESRNRNLAMFVKGSSFLVDSKNKDDDNDNDNTSSSRSSSRSRDSSSRSGGNTMSSSRRNNAAAAAEEEVDCILVCTDRAARGVDFEAAPVDHVVLFDFPKDPAEYVRRVGRVARAGRTGTSTVLAYGWQLPIARSVMDTTTKALDSRTMTTTTNEEDDDDDDEHRGGARDRRQRQKKNLGDKNAMIKGNIENGRLWSDR